MLQYVNYKLEPEWERRFLPLKKELEGQAVVCRNVRESILHDGLHSLLLTDDEKLAAEAGCRGIACIGVAGQENGFFEGTEMVLEDFGDASVILLEEYLRRFHGFPVTIARTEHLMLREICSEDLDVLLCISEQEGMQYARRDMAGENGFQKERMEAYIRQAYRLCGYGLWAVIMQGEVIGCCGFAACETEEQGLELEYMLDEKVRGRGFGTEMCKAALQYAYERLGVDCIWVRIHPANQKAQAFAEKLGFVPEGVQPARIKVENGTAPSARIESERRIVGHPEAENTGNGYLGQDGLLRYHMNLVDCR